MKARFPETAENQPELLGHHYAAARMPEVSLDYWHAAAQRAIELSAYAEAIHALDAALAQLRHLPEDRTRDARELELQVG